MAVTIVKRKPATIRLVSYHTWQKVRDGYNSSFRCALVKAGNKWLKVVALDATAEGGLRVWKVTKDDERFMKPLLRNGKPYPLARALRVFRSVGKTHGCTRAAKNIIREAAQ